jgi:hypothetical protein
MADKHADFMHDTVATGDICGADPPILCQSTIQSWHWTTPTPLVRVYRRFAVHVIRRHWYGPRHNSGLPRAAPFFLIEEPVPRENSGMLSQSRHYFSVFQNFAVRLSPAYLKAGMRPL